MKDLLFALLLLAMFTVPRPGIAADPCLDCHAQKTPGVVAYWKASAHAGKKVGCVDCHGPDVNANHTRRVSVDAARCGSCHTAALATHQQSKHAIGLRSGKGCTRKSKMTDEQQRSCTFCHDPDTSVPRVGTECAMFLAQSPEMQRQGCTACHRVEVSCDACHTRHGTSLSVARDPGTCGVCHMGPDHPQLEMWETSMHGVLYKQAGAAAAPSCVTCHMASGSHDVSRGISSPLSRGQTTVRRRERESMLDLCSACHTREFSARTLADGDRIAEQSAQAVAEAQGIVTALQRDGLLVPSPTERPPHPLFGANFVIGPHMLYENLSTVESTFFQLKQFYAPIAYKGAFHQNPDYAHWFGNAPMKLALSEIKSEAALLRQVQVLKKRIDNLSAAPGAGGGELEDVKRQLRTLEEKRLKGELGAQEYDRLKKKLLDEKGL
jgi:hydroxylamine dehydrogenase